MRKGTKHALTEIPANKFPDELGFRLPPKRRPWMSKDYRMDILMRWFWLRCTTCPSVSRNNRRSELSPKIGSLRSPRFTT